MLSTTSQVGQRASETVALSLYRKESTALIIPRLVAGHGKKQEGTSIVGSIEEHLAKVLKAQGAGKPQSVLALEKLKEVRKQAAQAEMNPGAHPGFRAVHEDLVSSVRAYNDAVLSDKGAFGEAWPLNTHAVPTFPMLR